MTNPEQPEGYESSSDKRERLVKDFYVKLANLVRAFEVLSKDNAVLLEPFQKISALQDKIHALQVREQELKREGDAIVDQYNKVPEKVFTMPKEEFSAMLDKEAENIAELSQIMGQLNTFYTQFEAISDDIIPLLGDRSGSIAILTAEFAAIKSVMKEINDFNTSAE